VPSPATLWALTCVAGQARLRASTSAGEPVTVARGQSAVVPAAAGDLEVEGRGVRLVATRTPR
jgi:mannose-6-phosphate isomerase class I